MTYTITITNPGAELVTVSLEWTTDAPTVAGLYFVDFGSFMLHVDVEENENTGHFFWTGGGTYGENTNYVADQSDCRWLGPLPMPPGGELCTCDKTIVTNSRDGTCCGCGRIPRAAKGK